MKLITTLIASTLLSLCFGCTWHDVVEHAQTSASAARLMDNAKLHHSSRWRIPVSSAVQVAAPSVREHAPAPWMASAQNGFNRVFVGDKIVHERAQTYVAHIHWPSTTHHISSDRTRSIKVAALGVLEVPKAPTTVSLTVNLADAAGTIVQTSEIAIAPALWGAAWDDEQALEGIFVKLAQEWANP